MKNNTSKIKNIKRVLAPVVRLAPRIKPRLKPVNDIRERHKGNVGQWTSIGDDPQFECEFPLFDLHTGWYMITLNIESSCVFDAAKLYVNLGDGYIEDEAIKVPYQSRKNGKRIFKFDRNAIGVRFDPLSSAGEFKIQEFTISPVAFKFAETRMLKKLMRWNPSQHEDTISATRKMLKQQAESSGQDYQVLLERRYSALFTAPRNNQNYSEWIEKVEEAGMPSADQVAGVANASNSPLLSLIMPTYNTDAELLTSTIESVIEQSYENWQLCISDDGSSSAETIETIKYWQQKDQRIIAVFGEGGGGIATNTNAALALATGDYCVFLDHDDLLAKNALYEVAASIIESPALKLIYSDEDKLDSTGVRIDPHFKPDWNPDLLLSQNYICHLVAIKRSIIENLGGLRTGFEGAQDHDLLLRVMRVVDAAEVKHIAKVLYHWRMTPESTASSSLAKNYSTDSGIAAIKDYLSQVSETATVDAGKYPNTYQVKWGLPAQEPKVSIIIPTRDRLDILSQCIGSVLQFTQYSNYEIIVVDNESVEPATLEYFEQISVEEKVRILKYDGVFNYSAINNYAVAQADGDIIVMMNNDIEVINEGWLQEMVGHALRPEVGCVGAKLLYKNNMVQHAGVILGIGGVAGHAHKYFDSESAGYFSRLHLTQNLSAVTAACLAVKKKTYQQLGGLNESHLKVAFNDVDFCLRAGALGLRNVWSPYALLYHHESVSRGHENTQEKQARFNGEADYMMQQWGDLLGSDPAYNRNLTLVREDFSLAA